MRIGIIGTNWGLMHVGGFRGAGAEVVALCGLEQAKTEEVAQREGIPHAVVEPAQLHGLCDAVVIASPDRLHFEHASAALAAGKHVLCEKPLTRTAEDANALAQQAAARGGQVAAVNFPYRQLPPFAALAKRLEALPPAKVLTVVIRNAFAASEGEAGATGDFCGVSHPVDAALWLMRSAPRSVQATLRGRPVCGVDLTLQLEGGARILLCHQPSAVPGIFGRWSLAGEGFEVEVEARYLPELGGWRISPVRLYQGGSWSEVSPGCSPQPGEREPWAQAHVETARAFLSAIRDPRAPRTLASFDDGARVQGVLDAAMRSELEGRRVGL